MGNCYSTGTCYDCEYLEHGNLADEFRRAAIARDLEKMGEILTAAKRLGSDSLGKFLGRAFPYAAYSGNLPMIRLLLSTTKESGKEISNGVFGQALYQMYCV